MALAEMSVRELRESLNRGDKLTLIDVREDDEWALGRIPGAVHIPLRHLAERGLAEWPPDSPIVLYCHHGGRSRRAQEFLQAHGFAGATNLAGGIDAWAREIDPSVPRY
jgi:rhodanese-related sulfurtransferase